MVQVSSFYVLQDKFAHKDVYLAEIIPNMIILVKSMIIM